MAVAGCPDQFVFDPTGREIPLFLPSTANNDDPNPLSLLRLIRRANGRAGLADGRPVLPAGPGFAPLPAHVSQRSRTVNSISLSVPAIASANVIRRS